MQSPRNSDHREPAVFGRFFRQMGPAWVISAVACGPATMASVSIAGAHYGYQLLWVVVLSALLAFVVQFMAAKVGLIGGKGIIALVEERWGNVWAWILMIDALLATWLAAAVLMKALVGTTGLVTGVVHALVVSDLCGSDFFPGGHRRVPLGGKGLQDPGIHCGGLLCRHRDQDKAGPERDGQRACSHIYRRFPRRTDDGRNYGGCRSHYHHRHAYL